MTDPIASFTLYGSEDAPLGNTSVTSTQECEIDFTIPAGAPARHLVQLYTDQNLYMSLTSGGTATPNNCELIPANSFRNITVSGIQGNGVAKSIYLLSATGGTTANVRISEIRRLLP